MNAKGATLQDRKLHRFEKSSPARAVETGTVLFGWLGGVIVVSDSLPAINANSSRVEDSTPEIAAIFSSSLWKKAIRFAPALRLLLDALGVRYGGSPRQSRKS